MFLRNYIEGIYEVFKEVNGTSQLCRALKSDMVASSRTRGRMVSHKKHRIKSQTTHSSGRLQCFVMVIVYVRLDTVEIPTDLYYSAIEESKIYVRPLLTSHVTSRALYRTAQCHARCSSCYPR